MDFDIQPDLETWKDLLCNEFWQSYIDFLLDLLCFKDVDFVC